MHGQPRPAEVKRALDRVAAAFFRAVSFETGESPRYEALHALFLERGLLVHASGGGAQTFGVGQFIATRQAMFGTGEVSRYQVSELSEITEVFGHVAHRASAFVRSGRRQGEDFENRGMIFMQLVRLSDGWRLSAVAWDDQQPGQTLAGHAEPTEFG